MTGLLTEDPSRRLFRLGFSFLSNTGKYKSIHTAEASMLWMEQSPWASFIEKDTGERICWPVINRLPILAMVYRA
jgi:hypothetical protein